MLTCVDKMLGLKDRMCEIENNIEDGVKKRIGVLEGNKEDQRKKMCKLQNSLEGTETDLWETMETFVDTIGEQHQRISGMAGRADLTCQFVTFRLKPSVNATVSQYFCKAQNRL